MRSKRMSAAVALASVITLSLTACGGAGGGDGDSNTTGGGASGDTGSKEKQTLNVLMVGNPQMGDIEKLTPDNFTKDTGIKINYTILPENELRDKVAQDVATKAGQYDVVTIGAYEGSVWTANNWLKNLTPYTEKDEAYDAADLLPAMTSTLSKDGNLYAAPFYGESAMTMYRKDIFDKYKLTMPDKPTWAEISDLASKLEGKEPDMTPLCLRGLPGWGENMAVVGSMIRSFGGGFFDADYKPQLTSPGTKKAVNWYVDNVTKYGEKGATQAGFTECLNNFTQGKAAMWFDATSAANSIESPASSKVVGKVGYADAPRDEMRAGWVWAWAFAIPETTKNPDTAWKFVSWATSKDYEQLAGKELGWTRVPDGKRMSTFKISEYQDATKAYNGVMLNAIEESDPTNCGVIPAPGPGCQYLAIPEFADLGTKIGQEISAAVAGQKTVDQALDASQKLAQAVADKKK